MDTCGIPPSRAEYRHRYLGGKYQRSGILPVGQFGFECCFKTVTCVTFDYPTYQGPSGKT